MSGRIPSSLEELVVDIGREVTLREFEHALGGSLNDSRSRELHRQFSELAPEAQEFVRELVTMVVDGTVYNTLRAFDDADDISVIVDADDRDDDLRVQTDGFASSYFGEGGWLEQHAVHPRSAFDAWIEPPDTSWLERWPKADR